MKSILFAGVVAPALLICSSASAATEEINCRLPTNDERPVIETYTFDRDAKTVHNSAGQTTRDGAPVNPMDLVGGSEALPSHWYVRFTDDEVAWGYDNVIVPSEGSLRYARRFNQPTPQTDSFRTETVYDRRTRVLHSLVTYHNGALTSAGRAFQC